eukprot:29365_1
MQTLILALPDLNAPCLNYEPLQPSIHDINMGNNNQEQSGTKSDDDSSDSGNESNTTSSNSDYSGTTSDTTTDTNSTSEIKENENEDTVCFADDNMDDIINEINDAAYVLNLQPINIVHVKRNKTTGEDEKTNLKIQLTLTESRNKSLWIHEPNQNPYKACKTYITKQRIKFLRDILCTIFKVSMNDIKSYSRPQTRDLLLHVLQMPVNRISGRDFYVIKETLKKIITEIIQYNNISQLFIEFLVADKKINPNNSFYKTVDALTSEPEYEQFMNSLWTLFCNILNEIGDLDKFEQWFMKLIVLWGEPCKLEKWTECYKLIELLLQKCNILICYPHRSLITTILFKFKGLFIEQIRKVVIREQYPLKLSDWNKISDYQGFAFGGSSANTAKKK